MIALKEVHDMTGKLFRFRRERLKPGFTLIEIMLVLLVISLLLTMVVPLFQKALAEAHTMRAKRFLKDLSQASEAFAEKTGVYPVAINELTDAVPPYMHENFCGQEKYGYLFQCFTDTNGYNYMAGLLPDNISSYTITTGGILRREGSGGPQEGW